MVPEILNKKGHGKPADWYLLGTLIYEMLVGAPPYFAHDRELIIENIKKSPLKLPVSLSS